MASLTFGRTKRRLLSTFMLALGLVVQPFSMVMANTAYAAPTVSVCAAGCDFTTLQAAVTGVDAGGVVTLMEDVTTGSQVTISKALTINGNSRTVSPTFSKTDNSNNAVFGVIGTSGVTLTNMTIDGVAGTNLHGVNVYESTSITLSGLSVNNNDRYGVVVNSSNVAVDSISTSGNGWGGINVDQVTQPAQVTMSGTNSHNETYQLYTEGVGASMIDNTTYHQYIEYPAGSGLYSIDIEAVGDVINTTTNKAFDSLQDAINHASTTNGDIIELNGDMVLSQQLTVTKAVTIDGNGHTVTGSFVKTNNSNNSVIGVQSDNVTISNVTINAVSGATNQLHGVNVYESDYVELTNVTAINGRSGVVVGQGSEVYASGITTAGNIWHGINVDKPGAYLQISGTNNHSEARQIFVDNKTVGTVNDIDNKYSVFEQAGSYTYVLTASLTNPSTGTVTLPVSGGVAITPVDSPLTLSQGQTTVVIPAGTTVSADPAWDGTMLAPATSAFTVPGDFQTGVAITVGSNNYTLTFDAPVKIVLAGQAGKRVGFVPALSNSFTEITTVCGADDQATVDAQMLALGVNECKINSGSDLVVWTNHFTTFATYTLQPAPQTNGSTSSTSTTRSGNFFSKTMYDDTWMEGANTEEGETYGNVKSNNVGLSGTATVNDNLQEVPTKGISWYWWLLGGVLAAGAWSLVSLLRSGRFNR